MSDRRFLKKLISEIRSSLDRCETTRIRHIIMSLALSLLVSFCPLFRLRVDSHIELEFIDALAHIICLLRSITLFDSRPTCLYSFDDADAARGYRLRSHRRRRVCLLDRARPPLSPSLLRPWPVKTFAGNRSHSLRSMWLARRCSPFP